MKILGIESSADETAAAVVADGSHILSNVLASQVELQRQFGGIVPEVAARSHLEVMLPVVKQALAEAKTSWDQIDGIAVTYGPGLIGSLLIGVLTAATLAQLKAKPLYAVNHVQAHVFANFLVQPTPRFPLLALIISGGHSQLVLFQDPLTYKLLGQTQDDAAGEAFDKVAKMLGLPYPGGPSVAKAALSGHETAYKLPTARLGAGSLDFSFSGLKTAVLRSAQTAAGRDHTLASTELPRLLSQQQKNDLAASFQKTIVDTLVSRLILACQRHNPTSVVIAGGVAANQKLRDELKTRLPLPIEYAPINLCTDNAAMIAALGYFLAQAGQSTDPTKLSPAPVLAM